MKSSMFVLLILTISPQIFAENIKTSNIYQETKCSSGVVFQMQISKQNYFVNENIDLEGIINNSLKNNIRINYINGIAPLSIKIIDLDRNIEVPLTPYGQKEKESLLSTDISITGIQVSAGDTYKFNIPVSRMYDLTLPSNYQIECKVKYFEDKNPLFLNANPLKFSVLKNPD